MKTALPLCLLLGAQLCLPIANAEQQNTNLLQEADLNAWQPYQAHGETHYSRVMDLEQGVVLRAESHGSASGYQYTDGVDLNRTPILQWQWTVESFPFFNAVGKDGIEKRIDKFDETQANGSDFAVRMTVGRHALFGDSKTLHYVWSSQSEAGGDWAIDSNNYVFVVNGTESSTLKWQTVSRQVADDWHDAFGEVIDEIDFVSFMTDTDDTKGQAVGYYGDIRVVTALDSVASIESPAN